MAAKVENSVNIDTSAYSFHNFGHKLSNFLTTMIPMTLLTGLCVAIGSAFGSTMAMVLSLGFATALNFTIYYFSADIVLALYDAQELNLNNEKQKVLDEVVAELAKEYDIPKPKVNVVDKSYLNAFATGRNPENAAVVATKGLLSRLKLGKEYDDKVLPNADFLTKRELKAIFAHELGHVINYDMLVSTVVATLTGVIGILADYMRAAALYGKSDKEDDSALGRFSVWLIAAIVPTIATLLQFVISRARESQADCTGAELMGEGASLASALRKISRFSSDIDVDGQKRHGYPEADKGFIESTKFLFIAEPKTSEKVKSDKKTNSAFDVNELNDPNDGWCSWALSLFSSHPPTKQRVKDLEEIDGNISKRSAFVAA